MKPNDSNSSSELMLSADDQRALDALMDAGFNPSMIELPAPADRLRVNALLNLLGLMKDYPVEDCEPALIDATMARIDQYETELARRLNFDVQQEERRRLFGGRIRMPDFITVAAVILIAAGVLWPTLSAIHQKSMDLSCANNMRVLGYALKNYSADNNEVIPMAKAGVGGSWDTIANVLNLQPLVEGHYCELNHLNCPGHHHDEVGPSYSYRWQMPAAPVHWNSGRVTVVLGDRNPLIDAARSGRTLSPLSMSINHNGRGQNVLASDGSVLWLEEPLIDRNDNIWLPNGSQELRSGQLPTEPGDVFLAH
jgi:hypothetical protein